MYFMCLGPNVLTDKVNFNKKNHHWVSTQTGFKQPQTYEWTETFAGSLRSVNPKTKKGLCDGYSPPKKGGSRKEFSLS